MITAHPNGVPLYERVRQQLREEILSSRQPGDLLPTQQEISRTMGTSVITVKRALSELASEGLVESIRGKGTVVRRVEVADAHIGVSSWTDSISSLGKTPSTKWTEIKHLKPTEQTLNLLKLSPSAKTVRISRLRMVQRQPICIISNELPEDLLPGFDKSHMDAESLYDCLHRHFQLTPMRAEEQVIARKSTASERKHLGANCDTVIVVNRFTLMANDRPMELSVIVANAARYSYHAQLFNDPITKQ